MSGAVKIQVGSELVTSSHARDTGSVYWFVLAISNNIILCFGFLCDICAIDSNSVSSVRLITINKRGDLNSLNSFWRNDIIVCRL